MSAKNRAGPITAILDEKEICMGDDKNVLTPKSTFILSLIITLVVFVIDWLTGYELQFFVFYFIPIGVAGLRCAPVTAYFIAILSGISWLVSDWLSGYPFRHLSYDIWNNTIRIIAFVVLAFAFVKIKHLIEADRKLSNELKASLSEIKTLKGLLPICAVCKKIRDDNGYWQQLEEYIAMHSDAQFTHGFCRECAAKILEDAGIDSPGKKVEPEDTPRTGSIAHRL